MRAQRHIETETTSTAEMEGLFFVKVVSLVIVIALQVCGITAGRYQPTGKDECSGLVRLGESCEGGRGICGYRPYLDEVYGHMGCIGFCGPPPEVPNAALNSTVDMESMIEGSELFFECALGYSAPDCALMSISCNYHGEWTGIGFECVRDCGPLDVSDYFDNAHVGEETGQTEGEVVVVECDDGFTQTGELHITCENGTWYPSTGACHIDCGAPAGSHFSDASLVDASYGTHAGVVVNYECDVNYYSPSCLTATCNASTGLWSYAGGPCVKDCGAPDATHFSDASLVDASYGSHAGVVVIYECDANYYSPSCLTATCDASTGLWSYAGGPCVKDCGAPDANHFSDASLVDASYGSHAGVVVNYECDASYYSSSCLTATCDANTGQWSYAGGPCLKDCGPVPPVDSASLVTYTGTWEGSTATYTCSSDGSTLTSTCAASGNWSDPGSCPADCGPPPTVDSASVTTSPGTWEGSTATYTCSSDGSTLTATCDASGSWSDPGSCPADCGSPPTVDSATVTTSPGTWEGSTATYTCSSDGSTLTSTCNADGSWSDPGSCPADCGSPPTVDSAIVTTSPGTWEGSTATYTCSSDGSTLTSTCNADGSWSDPGSCPADCGSPPTVDSATVTTSPGTWEGSTATYTCSSDGSTFTSTCNADGSWSDLGSCPADCGSPLTVDSATVTTSPGTWEGSTATYTCSSDGSTFTSTCNADGSWSDPGSCPADCGSPPTVDSATVTTSPGTWEGSTATYTCSSDGSTLTSTCNADGSWSDPGSCPTGCSNPPIVPNAILVGSNGTDAGSYATYECTEFATAVVNDRPTIYCINGQWEEALITCAAVDEPCPEVGENWYRFLDYCYTFDESQKLIDDAQAYCASLNASLVYIEDDIEMEYVLNFATYSPNYCCWWMDLRYINGVWMMKDDSTDTYTVATFTFDLPLTDPTTANGTCAMFDRAYQPPDSVYHWETRDCESSADKEKAICKKYSPLPEPFK